MWSCLLPWMMARTPSRSTIVVSAWRWRQHFRPWVSQCIWRAPRYGLRRHVPQLPACFAALSRYELSVVGKKIVGSAQKRAQRALLQHGSIPLWMDRQRLFQCLQVPPEHRAALVQTAYTTMGAVNEVAPRLVSLAAVHEALRQRVWRNVWGRRGRHTHLSRRMAPGAALCATKYATDAWNLDGAAAWRHHLS